MLCAFANASRCINQHWKFNSFERSASHIENGSRIGREYCVISILLDRAKRARISLRIEKTQKETERVSIRSIRSTGRVIPTFVRCIRLHSSTGRQNEMHPCRGTRRKFFLSFSPRPSFQPVSQYYRDGGTSFTFVSGYCEILAAESSRFAFGANLVS